MKIVGKRRVDGRYYKTWLIYVKTGSYYACVKCVIFPTTKDKYSVLTDVFTNPCLCLPDKKPVFKTMTIKEKLAIDELCAKEILKILG